jgi:hypothetical protein
MDSQGTTVPSTCLPWPHEYFAIVHIVNMVVCTACSDFAFDRGVGKSLGAAKRSPRLWL